MASKGKRQKGSFAHDYDIHVMWNTHINLTDTDLDAIAEAGKVELSAEQRLDLKAEIETYASLAEAERCAPAVGGSGRSNDFFDQHIQRLAEIYREAGGTVSLGRRNPSKKYTRGVADSNFLSLCVTINNLLPYEIQRQFNSGASDGLARAIRRALSIFKQRTD